MASKKKRKEKIEQHVDASVISAIGKELEAYNRAMKDSEKRKAKDKFMDLYQKAEYAYKHLLIDYKIKVDGLESVPGCKPQKGDKKFNPDNLSIVDSQVDKVFKYGGIDLDKRLFCLEEEYKQPANKSCRQLRNEITHSSSKRAIDEVFSRREELYSVIQEFLSIFAEPEKSQEKKTA